MTWVYAVVIKDTYHWIDSLWIEADGAAARADSIRRSADATGAKIVVFRARYRLEDARLQGEECGPQLVIVPTARVSTNP